MLEVILPQRGPPLFASTKQPKVYFQLFPEIRKIEIDKILQDLEVDKELLPIVVNDALYKESFHACNFLTKASFVMLVNSEESVYCKESKVFDLEKDIGEGRVFMQTR